MEGLVCLTVHIHIIREKVESEDGTEGEDLRESEME